MIPYHVACAILGIGDLHPGGGAESERLVSALAKGAPGRALEIGGGAGFSAERLRKAGFAVTVIEPDRRLAARLTARGENVVVGPLREAAIDGPFDAVLAESVLYDTPLDGSFSKIRSLLRPGGLLAFVDMVWTAKAGVEDVARIHDESEAAFGIAMASREPLTWDDWKFRLAARRLSIVDARRLGDGSPGAPTDRGGFAARLLHPQAAWSIARAKGPQVLPGWLESWSAVVRRD